MGIKEIKDMEYGLPSDIRLTDHFVDRWMDREPDNWGRFLWALENKIYYVICKDSTGLSHCMYYNPESDNWYIFMMNIQSRISTLVTIYHESYYMEFDDDRGIFISDNKAKALTYYRKRVKESVILKFLINNNGRVIEKCVNIPWNAVWEYKELYAIGDHFEDSVEKLISNDKFLTLLSESYPILGDNDSIIESWVVLFKKDYAIEVS